MRDWIKVWWHCLVWMMKGHRMVKVHFVNGKTSHCCDCGYNMPKDFPPYYMDILNKK